MLAITKLKMKDKNEYYTNLFIKNNDKIKIRILCSALLSKPNDKEVQSDNEDNIISNNQ